MLYKVKEVAAIAGVSVRTLHYYDDIGLLKPQSISPAGYRLYTDHNLERLQMVLFFKELGFSLQETRDVLDSPGFDLKKALIAHRDLMIKKKNRLDKLIASVEQTMESIEGGAKMNNKKMFEAFDMKEIEEHQKKYADETKQKYGHTDAYKESMKKTSKYAKEDWERVMTKAGEIYNKIAANMDKEPADNDVQEAVGEWRQHITDNFYECTPEIFRGLGDLYVNDPRFTANIDKYGKGLAAFMREAMHVYCDNLENAK